VQIEPLPKQSPKGRVVEQCHRTFAPEAPEHGFKQPSGTSCDDTERISPVDLTGSKITPDKLQATHCAVKIVRARGNRGRIYRAGRCTADNREWITAAVRQNVRQRPQYANLVSGARPAPGENKGSVWLLACGPTRRGAPSTDLL
jgi:hypothetical protein